MYRKINYEKFNDFDIEKIFVTCQGLRNFRIIGIYRPNSGYELWGDCHASTRYLYNAFVSIFGKGYFYITLNSKEEAYNLVENFIALVETMNAGFEEEEKLKQEKLKQYRKEYYQKQKAEKAKRNAIIRSGRKHR